MNNEIILLGAGPSLKEFDFKHLDGMHFMTFNRMYISFQEFPQLPKYHVVIDQTVLKDNKEDIRQLIESYPSITFFLRDIDLFSLNNKQYFGEHENLVYCKTPHNKKKINLKLGRKRILKDTQIVANLDYFGDAGCFGLQLCYHMNYDTVYLAGIDASFEANKKRNAKTVYSKQRAVVSDTDDFAHYRADYYGKGKLYTQDISNKAYIWRLIKEQNIPNFKIINVCDNSKLNIFPIIKNVFK